MTQRYAGRRGSGFTLIELLVAIGLLALMAGLSFRGVDTMVRSQTRLHQHADDVLALQAGLAQWSADLDAMAEQPNTPSIDWDGRALRILRTGSSRPGEGLRVVAWSSRNIDGINQWLRWQSPPLTTRGALQMAWQQAALWGQNPSDDARQREVRIAALTQWQIFYYRNDAWSNSLSSAGAVPPAQPAASAPASTVPPVPDGVRLVLTLAPGQAIQGTITRDWVRTTLGGGR